MSLQVSTGQLDAINICLASCSYTHLGHSGRQSLENNPIFYHLMCLFSIGRKKTYIVNNEPGICYYLKYGSVEPDQA